MGIKEVKWAAKWSLGSFAKMHAPVLEQCEEEASRRTGRASCGAIPK
jgi:hypothetical protein